jgi:hypothetical protein
MGKEKYCEWKVISIHTVASCGPGILRAGMQDKDKGKGKSKMRGFFAGAQNDKLRGSQRQA